MQLEYMMPTLPKQGYHGLSVRRSEVILLIAVNMALCFGCETTRPHHVFWQEQANLAINKYRWKEFYNDSYNGVIHRLPDNDRQSRASAMDIAQKAVAGLGASERGALLIETICEGESKIPERTLIVLLPEGAEAVTDMMLAEHVVVIDTEQWRLVRALGEMFTCDNLLVPCLSGGSDTCYSSVLFMNSEGEWRLSIAATKMNLAITRDVNSEEKAKGLTFATLMYALSESLKNYVQPELIKELVRENILSKDECTLLWAIEGDEFVGGAKGALDLLDEAYRSREKESGSTSGDPHK